MARKPNPNNPRCPDCGGVSIGNGMRGGSDIRRWRCKGEVPDTKCATKPRRFTDLTKGVLREDAIKEAVPVREALRDDTHVFLITWAQNATKVHPGFWRALNACKDQRNADLIVIKGTYRNPTIRGEQVDDEWWVDEVMEAGLWDKRSDLCPALTLLADVRVRPTAQRPLTGYDSITAGRSGILGHPKLEMRVIPTPQQALPKQMQTTGACTVKNYSQSGAGAKGDFHHTIGAIIVEVRGDAFHMRQLNACRDGSFIDLATEYFPDGSWQDADRALALSLGDWHSGFTDPNVIDATFGVGQQDCIVGVLRPRELIWDDLLDQYGRNHHHRLNPLIAVAKARDAVYDRDDLRNEVFSACEEVNYFTQQTEEVIGESVRSVIKSSNHDEALTRYILERNWKNDPHNAEFYLETALKMVKETEMQETGAQYPSAFHVWARDILRKDTLLLGRRDSHMVADIECALHGDLGPNGARGSIVNLSKIGVKTIIAHAHVPGIVGGCYQSGTSTYLNLEYALGPSSWMNSHVAVYANGKRAIITILDGEWRHE